MKKIHQFLLIVLLLPAPAWANQECDQMATIAEDTMRERQSGSNFFIAFRPIIDGYIERIKQSNSISEVRILTTSFERVFAIAVAAQSVDIEVEGKLQNEAIYSFADKIKTVCLEYKP